MSRQIGSWVPAVLALSVCLVFYSGGHAQGVLEPHPYLRHAVIGHHNGVVTVQADFARPLEQAIAAVSHEYGWAVDYEDPPFQSGYDVTDVTNPKYRASHPNAPPVLGPAGGAFRSTYPETPSMWSSPAVEQEVLERIVSDYNQSQNPGNFSVRALSDGRFDVIGTSIRDNNGADVPVTPFLDTVLSLPRTSGTAGDTISAVLRALSLKTGLQVVIGTAPGNFMADPGRATMVGGVAGSARTVLMQVVDSMGNWVWQFNYNPQHRLYILNLLPVMRSEYDPFGQKRLVPVAPAPVPGP